MKMSKQDVLKGQEELYDKKAEGYLKHHGDKYSQAYRTDFIRKRLFDKKIGLNLNGKKVLDAMSAFGPETGFLIENGAIVVGLDISKVNAEFYQSKWKKECYVASIHETNLPDASFDVIYICGGLHHVIPLLDKTMVEMHRILKTGGYLCFMEPSKDTCLDAIRVVWYKLDKRFEENESALSYKKTIKKYLGIGFEEILYKTGGNIAYLLISQSLIVGIPSFIKKIIYKPLFVLERLFDYFPFTPQLYFLAVWKKK